MLTVWQLSACWLCMLNQHVYFFSGQPSVKTSVLSWSRRSTKWTWTLERFVVTVVGGVNKPWMLLSEENEPSMVNWRWKVTRALDTRKRAQRRFFQRGRTAMFVVMVTPFGQRPLVVLQFLYLATVIWCLLSFLPQIVQPSRWRKHFVILPPVVFIILVIPIISFYVSRFVTDLYPYVYLSIYLFNIFWNYLFIPSSFSKIKSIKITS